MYAVRYDRFGGIDQLYLAETPEPSPAAGEVVVGVEAGALNPGALSALNGAAFTPIRDLAGTVTAVGAGVTGFAVGDDVLGWVQSWDAHAEQVAIPAVQLIRKPAVLAWDVAGSLYTTPMAGVGAVKGVSVAEGDVVVISGASGGVGSVATQYAIRRGARVIGLTSRRHIDLLHRYGAEPVVYGEGEEDRIRTAAGADVTAFIDAVGGHYIDLALALGVEPDRIATVVDYQGAKEKGVKALGTRDAGGLDALAELAGLATAGDLAIPIAGAYSLDRVQDAYRALRDRRDHGRIVLHPHDVSRPTTGH
jgi:NADPH2:quinone reductase